MPKFSYRPEAVIDGFSRKQTFLLNQSMRTDTCRSVSFFVNHVSDEMSESLRLFWDRSTFCVSVQLCIDGAMRPSINC